MTIRIEPDLKNLSEVSNLKAARVEMRRFAQTSGESGPRSALRVSRGLHAAVSRDLTEQAEEIALDKDINIADAVMRIEKLSKNRHHFAVWSSTPVDAREADAVLVG